MMTVVTYSVALSLLMAVTAIESMPFIRMKDLPGVANPEKAKWMSMSKDVEFLQVDDLPKKKSFKRVRSLEGDDRDKEGNEQDGENGDDEVSDGDDDGKGEFDTYNPYSVQPFVEGMGDYDEYQQAWRLLGFMIDCNAVSSDDNEDERGHGSNSADVTDEGCARYVMWAAVRYHLVGTRNSMNKGFSPSHSLGATVR